MELEFSQLEKQVTYFFTNCFTGAEYFFYNFRMINRTEIVWGLAFVCLFVLRGMCRRKKVQIIVKLRKYFLSGQQCSVQLRFTDTNMWQTRLYRYIITYYVQDSSHQQDIVHVLLLPETKTKYLGYYALHLFLTNAP